MQAYHGALRAHAEAAISECEAAIHAGGDAAKDASTLAHCAAAMLDGFSYAEVALHPLLSVSVRVGHKYMR